MQQIPLHRPQRETALLTSSSSSSRTVGQEISLMVATQLAVLLYSSPRKLIPQPLKVFQNVILQLVLYKSYILNRCHLSSKQVIAKQSRKKLFGNESYLAWLKIYFLSFCVCIELSLSGVILNNINIKTCQQLEVSDQGSSLHPALAE